MQDAEQPLVVVTANLSIERRNDGQMFAAHLEDLGLTAYGRTVEEARKELIGVFNVWVNFYREKGLLEERLNQMGAEWTWLHAYEGDIPVEYTNVTAHACQLCRRGRRLSLPALPRAQRSRRVEQPVSIRYDELAALLRHEGFRELAPGYFIYEQAGSSPWLFACLPDPDGYVSPAHVASNLERLVPYLDVAARLRHTLGLDQ